MEIFTTTLNQTAFLFTFILIGYMLVHWKYVPDNAQTVLARLENGIFIPALVLGTFMENFTVQTIAQAWKLMLWSLFFEVIVILISLFCVRFFGQNKYEKNIYTYGLCFSNFGFMGNAVVSALYPDVFFEYLIFTLPLWALIYLWGVPVLLLENGSGRITFAQRMKNFVNPMFVCTILGMVIGLIDIPMPPFVSSVVSVAGSCMSPIAMLLTGMTIAQFKLWEILKK